MDETEKRIFDAQEAVGIHRKIGEFFLSFCVPMYWWISDSPTAIPHVLHNGTAFFVDTGKATFGITCHHVLKRFRADRQTYPNLTCQVGSYVCNTIDDYIISDDEGLDLATFKIGRNVEAYRCESWPPRAMQPGDDYILS